MWPWTRTRQGTGSCGPPLLVFPNLGFPTVTSHTIGTFAQCVKAAWRTVSSLVNVYRFRRPAVLHHKKATIRAQRTPVGGHRGRESSGCWRAPGSVALDEELFAGSLTPVFLAFSH